MYFHLKARQERLAIFPRPEAYPRSSSCNRRQFRPCGFLRCKGEVEEIYLNFSDPWPKTRHAKRRLTSYIYLDIYRNILASDGAIIQKTDNRSLFESSLESLSQNDWYLTNISLDLHKTDLFNITTEYEDKWSPKGPIYRLEARMYKDPNRLKEKEE